MAIRLMCDAFHLEKINGMVSRFAGKNNLTAKPNQKPSKGKLRYVLQHPEGKLIVSANLGGPVKISTKGIDENSKVVGFGSMLAEEINARFGALEIRLANKRKNFVKHYLAKGVISTHQLDLLKAAVVNHDGSFKKMDVFHAPVTDSNSGGVLNALANAKLIKRLEENYFYLTHEGRVDLMKFLKKAQKKKKYRLQLLSLLSPAIVLNFQVRSFVDGNETKRESL